MAINVFIVMILTAKIRGFWENCKKKTAEKFGGFLGGLLIISVFSATR
jgi:hypothetical protein